MKQGRASSNVASGQKREPISHAVCIPATARIGQIAVTPSKTLYEGRGYQAPSIGASIHKSGSQGKR